MPTQITREVHAEPCAVAFRVFGLPQRSFPILHLTNSRLMVYKYVMLRFLSMSGTTLPPTGTTVTVVKVSSGLGAAAKATKPGRDPTFQGLIDEGQAAEEERARVGTKRKSPHNSRGGGAPRKSDIPRQTLEIPLDADGNPVYQPNDFHQQRIHSVKIHLLHATGVTKFGLPDKVDADDEPKVHPLFGCYAATMPRQIFNSISTKKQAPETTPEDKHKSIIKMWNNLGFCIQTTGDMVKLTYSQVSFKKNGWRIQGHTGRVVPVINFVNAPPSTSL